MPQENQITLGPISVPNFRLNPFQAPKIIFNMSPYSAYFVPQMPGQGFPTIILTILLFLSNVMEYSHLDNYSSL